MYRILFAGALALSTLNTPALAESARQIVVTGQAQTAVAPDRSRISLGVEEQAETAGAALAATAQAMKAVFAALDAAGIAREAVRTTDIGLYPVYSDEPYDRKGPRPILGFRASNMVDIVIGNIDGIGAVLDSLTKAGVNRVNGIAFELSETGEVMQGLRGDAVRDARNRAQTYAEAAGVTLGPVQSIRETGGVPDMPVYADRAGMREMSIPVSGGTLDFSTSVTVVFGIE